MKSKGFTVVELVAALAVIAIFASMSVPLLQRSSRRVMLRRTAQAMVADVAEARGLAAAGARRGTPWSSTDRTRSTVLEINDDHSYVVAADRDMTDDGDEIVVATVQLPTNLRILSPSPGTMMRFRANGTVIAPFDIVLQDRESRASYTVVVSSGGLARVK